MLLHPQATGTDHGGPRTSDLSIERYINERYKTSFNCSVFCINLVKYTQSNQKRSICKASQRSNLTAVSRFTSRWAPKTVCRGVTSEITAQF